MKFLTFVDGCVKGDQCCFMFTAAVSIEKGIPLAITSLPICYSCLTDIDYVCNDGCAGTHYRDGNPPGTGVEGSPCLFAEGSSMVVYQTVSI